MASPINIPIDFQTQEALGQLARLDNSIDRLRQSMDQVGNSFRRSTTLQPSFTRGFSEAARSSASLQRNLQGVRRLLGAGFAGYGLIQAVRQLAELQDSATRLNSQFRQITANASELVRVQRQVYQLAVDTRAPVEAAATLYARIARSLEGAFPEQQILQFTRNVLQLAVATGASVQEMRAGFIQLAQGISSARLQGDELRSVMENIPEVARVLARELGIPFGALRRQGASNALNAQAVFGALSGPGATASAEQAFCNVQLTFGQVFTRFRNQLQEAFLDVDAQASLRELSTALDGLVGTAPAMASAMTGLTGALTRVLNHPFLSAAGLAALLAAGSAPEYIALYQRGRQAALTRRGFELDVVSGPYGDFIDPSGTGRLGVRAVTAGAGRALGSLGQLFARPLPVAVVGAVTIAA